MAPEAVITSVEMTPSPAFVRRPVDIAVKGRGTCSFSVDFGDGNSHEEAGTLPLTVKHTYAVADTYVVIVRPAPPCTGKFTQKLTVATAPPQPDLTGINVTPARATAGQPVTIEVIGSGTCSYAIDFGDGNLEKRSRPLPDRLQHNYPVPDAYTVAVKAESPCAGSARTTLVVRPRSGDRVSITQISWSCDGRTSRLTGVTPKRRSTSVQRERLEAVRCSRFKLRFGPHQSASTDATADGSA